jgi:hypothetical protein
MESIDDLARICRQSVVSIMLIESTWSSIYKNPHKKSHATPKKSSKKHTTTILREACSLVGVEDACSRMINTCGCCRWWAVPSMKSDQYPYKENRSAATVWFVEEKTQRYQIDLWVCGGENCAGFQGSIMVELTGNYRLEGGQHATF